MTSSGSRKRGLSLENLYVSIINLLLDHISPDASASYIREDMLMGVREEGSKPG